MFGVVYQPAIRAAAFSAAPGTLADNRRLRQAVLVDQRRRTCRQGFAERRTRRRLRRLRTPIPPRSERRRPRGAELSDGKTVIQPEPRELWESPPEVTVDGTGFRGPSAAATAPSYGTVSFSREIGKSAGLGGNVPLGEKLPRVKLAACRCPGRPMRTRGQPSPRSDLIRKARFNGWTCPSRVEDNDITGRGDERSGQRSASPNDQAETHGTPAAGDTCRHLRNRRLATSSRVDSARWCAWRSFSSCCCWWSSPAVPSSLPLRRARRSCSAPLSASLLNRLGIEARAAGLDYRPSSLGVTLHAVNIRQSTAARPFLKAERVEVDFSPAILRGTLVLRRLDVTKPEVVLDSTTQGASPVRRLTARGRLTHDPPQPFPHSTSRRAGARSRGSRLSVQTARTSLFAGSRCRSPAKGQESCGERLSFRVGGRSGAERRRLASIGHGRTCHSAERRWPSRRSRWSRRWRRSAGPRTSTSAAAISR